MAPIMKEMMDAYMGERPMRKAKRFSPEFEVMIQKCIKKWQNEMIKAIEDHNRKIMKL
jgi:hypothetical protein